MAKLLTFEQFAEQKVPTTDDQGAETINASTDGPGDLASPGITPETSAGCKKPVRNLKKLPKEKLNEMLADIGQITETLSDAGGTAIKPIPSETIKYACTLATKYGMMGKLVSELHKLDALQDFQSEAQAYQSSNDDEFDDEVEFEEN